MKKPLTPVVEGDTVSFGKHAVYVPFALTPEYLETMKRGMASMLDTPV